MISKESRESDKTVLRQQSKKLFMDEEKRNMLHFSDIQLERLRENSENMVLNAGVDDRSVFKIRVVDSNSIGNNIDTSEQLMQKANIKLNESLKRREGNNEKFKYLIQDSLSVSIDSGTIDSSVEQHDDGDFIKGGELFAKEIRLRSMKAANYSSSVSLASTKSAIAKNGQGKLHSYFSELFDKVGEKEIIVGSGMGSVGSDYSDFTKGYKR